MNPKEAIVDIVGQIRDLLDLIDNSIYCQPLALFEGGTIGQHCRHMINFYLCITEGAHEKLIDYSKRVRHPDWETDIAEACKCLDEVVRSVDQLDCEQRVKVRADLINADEVASPIVQSSVGRELVYAFDHTIHHLAIIKMGIQNQFPDLKIRSDMGVAPSTLTYRKGHKFGA